MAEPDASELSTFPTDPDVFDDDERISFSKLDSKYVAVQENGTELEFDAELKRWIPIIDEALIEEQQSGYGELEPELDTSRPVQARKRKKDEREVSCD
jgi:HIV Tat-specific factor 1